MKAIELLGKNGELTHKLRSTKDLIRHIETRTEKTSNYSLLIGAGASVTSGIRSASELIDEWLTEIYEIYEDKSPDSIDTAKRYFEKEHASWYNPSNPYSSLFEKRYDLPSQRRRFVEQEVDNKLPSIGYTYLTSLIDNNYLNTIFTTNFDDLINEAFYQFSNNRPILCAQDSAISSISVTSKRPKIIKLHGDYLFDDIKSTLRETESLEQNTKEKLVEYCKEFGLIVIGYAGNDRSIMDVLEYLSKQDNYLKNGIYWCLRKEDHISPALRNLLWKDKIYPVLIDGFDELMATSHKKLIGRNLDVESNLNHSKLQTTIKYILEDNYNLSKNAVIKTEINQLKNNSSSQDISNFLQILTGDKSQEKIDNESSLSDTRNFLEIDTLINKREFKIALSQCEQYCYRSENPKIKSKYIKKIIQICKFSDDYNLSLVWADRLLELDQYNSNNILIKASCIETTSNRYRYLQDSLMINKYSYSILNEAVKEGLEFIKSNPKNNTVDIDKLLEFIEKSLNFDSSLDNLAWELKHSILSYLYEKETDQDSKKDIRKKIDNLVIEINKINKHHTTSIELTTKSTNSEKNYSKSIALINNLYKYYETSSLDKKNFINKNLSNLIINLPTLKDKDKNTYKSVMDNFFQDHYTEKDSTKDHSIQIQKSRYLVGQNKDIESAEKIVNGLLSQRKFIYNIGDILLISPSFENFDYKKIDRLLDKEEHTLKKLYFHESKSNLNSYMNNYDEALRHLEKAFEAGLDLETYLTYKTFYLLKNNDFEEVILIGSKYIDYNYEAFLINFYYAAKKLGSDKYNEVNVRNLSAQSSDSGVKICAFSILGNTNSAKNIMKEAIEEDFSNKTKFLTWPAIQSLLNDTLEEAA